MGAYSFEGRIAEKELAIKAKMAWSVREKYEIRISKSPSFEVELLRRTG